MSLSIPRNGRWLALVGLILVAVLQSAPAIARAAPPGIVPYQADVGGMDLGNMPSGIATAIGLLAVGIVQYAKFAGMPDGWGPFAVVIIAILIVGLWALGEFQRAHMYGSPLGYLFDVANVTFAAAGAYGFSRANSAASVTTWGRNPPSGPFQAPTDGDPPAIVPRR